MIKLSLPHLGGTEINWVNEAFRESWVVPLGPNVDEFERRLENYLDAPAVVALSAGTAAIHLGLVMLGIKPGDEVICQSMTFSASANPILYQGATPVFVDSEESTWNMDPDLLEQCIRDRIETTGRRPRAIIAVDLYGMPAQLDRINAIGAQYGIPVLEDAAEALGSTFGGRCCGLWGRYGALSFNGNKVITTSGGGAIVCPDRETAERVKFLATQARENRPYYYHEVVGYNYRLSNVSAGIGCGQMDVLQDHVDRRRAIHDKYVDMLADCTEISVLCNPDDRFSSNYWLTTVIIDPASGITPEAAREAMLARGIETRLLWRPMHMQPVFKDAKAYVNGVSERLFSTGLCLPSSSSLTDEEVTYVVSELKSLIKGK